MHCNRDPVPGKAVALLLSSGWRPSETGLDNFCAVSCATKSRAWQLARRENRPSWDCLYLLRFPTVFLAFPSFQRRIGSLIQTGTNAIQSSGGVRTLRGGARCFFFGNRKAGVTLAGWRREERTRATQRVGQPGRAGRTTAQPPPAPRGVGAREGACCQALGLMHPACFALAAVRDGGDQNYLPPRRPGDTVSGETVGAGGQSHSGRLQKCPQETKLQILLQIYGRWLRVTVKGVHCVQHQHYTPGGVFSTARLTLT